MRCATRRNAPSGGSGAAKGPRAGGKTRSVLPGGNRLIRPLSEFTGTLGKKWVPLTKRNAEQVVAAKTA